MKPVEAQADAYQRRDIEGFVRSYSDDVRVYRNGNLWISGITELRDQYRDLFNESPHLSLEVLERTVEGPYVYDTERITGLRGDPNPILAYVRYKIENGKISEVQISRTSCA